MSLSSAAAIVTSQRAAQNWRRLSTLSSATLKQQVIGMIFTSHYCLLLNILVFATLGHSIPNRINLPRYNHQDVTSSDTQDLPAQDNGDAHMGADLMGSDNRDDGLPAPNELSVIRLNDTSVVLRWDFPQESQEHLQFFKVQYKSTRKNAEWKTDNQEILTTTRAYQINGLKPGNCLFSVIAVYDNDDNVPSEPLKFRIRARSKIKSDEMPEMKPPKIYWTEAQQDFFRFKWRYDPKANDTEYYGFLVYYRSAHTVSDFTIYNTLDTNVEIAELDPDTPYEAKVVAYNTVGVSDFSETITIRTAPLKQNATTSPSSNTQPTSTVSPNLPTTYTTTNTSATVTITPTTNRPSPSWPAITNSLPSTPKPSVTVSSPNNSRNGTDLYQSIISLLEMTKSELSDRIATLRNPLMIAVPSIIVIWVMFCLRPKKKEKSSPPSSTDGLAQLHIEINGYFKNSFPGVDEDYAPISDTSKVHNGFVNPHLDDFA